MTAKRTIRELRQARGWSQEKLAREMGVSLSTVAGLENNRHEPRMEQVRKILELFGITWEEVIWPEKSQKLMPAA